jgi:predicted XRE-type DNA-binding protein
MKFENTEVFNFAGAIRGMRNPLESWDKSDTVYGTYWGEIDGHKCFDNDGFCIGKNDLTLMQKLIKAGSEHRKFMRQIFVSVDITAPSYFMAELDTYKIGTTRNSTSMQHKGTSHRYTIDDFEVDEQIKEVLREKTKEYQNLFYPYETQEYKIYICENGRQYEVYKNGRIFALPFSYTDTYGRTRNFEKREVFPSKTRTGYFEINIGGRNCEKWLLHRLIAYVWIDNPNAYATVDHLDGNKANNSVENLEWVSLEENIKREWENGLVEFDLQTAYKKWKISSKIMPDVRLKIQKLYQEGKSQKELAEIFDVSQSQISVIVRNTKNTSDNKELFEHCWYWEKLIENLNILRDKYLDTKDYKYFRLIRQLMPMSYLYKSTITMNYENLLSMIHQRKNHKLTEWSIEFIKWVKTLPYPEELLFLEK